VVALDELSRLTRHIRDPEARVMAGELYRKAWKEIADHFHAPTRQWGGPQSLAYQTLLPQNVCGFLHRATSGRFPCGEIEPEITEHRLLHTCPHDIEPRFLSLVKPREQKQTFFVGEDGRPDIIGTTYLAPTFTLGTVNTGDLWAQRRALLAYWGTAAAPSSLRLRFLHDGQDFTGAHLFCAQQAGNALCGVSFAVDGFDTHVVFDPIKDGTIRAHDMRLRFEFEGSVVGHLPPAPLHLTEPWVLKDANLSISIVMLHAAWGNDQGHWLQGKADGRAWLDVVLYTGEEQDFRLSDLSDAACAFAVRLLPGAAQPQVPKLNLEAGLLTVADDNLQVTFAAVPVSLAKLADSFSSSAT
jgi:hypothetical protein